jgi:cell division protein FtsN
MTYDSRTRDRYRLAVVGVSGAVAVGVLAGTAAIAHEASSEYAADQAADPGTPTTPTLSAVPATASPDAERPVPAQVIAPGPVFRLKAKQRPTVHLAQSEAKATREAEPAKVVVRPVTREAEPAAKKPAAPAKKPATTKPAVKKPAAAKAAPKKPAVKKPAPKKPAPKKPAAKKPAAQKPAQEEPHYSVAPAHENVEPPPTSSSS